MLYTIIDINEVFFSNTIQASDENENKAHIDLPPPSTDLQSYLKPISIK